MRSPWSAVLVLALACGGSGDSYGAECTAVRDEARVASTEGERLRDATSGRAATSEESAAIERSARAYVTAVRSRTECFSAGQRENADEIAEQLPSGSAQPLQK